MNPVRSTTRTRRLVALAATGALVLGAAACGDDDDDDASPSTTEGAADLASYCDAQVALDQTFQQLDSQDPDVFQTTLAAARPKVEDVLADVPDELADEYEVLEAAYEETVATGDPAAFFTDAVTTADAAVHEHDTEHCDWSVIPVTAEDFRFVADFPTAPGPVSFDLNNEGAEPHVLIVVRKKDSVDGSALDAFNALESEADLPASFDQAAVVFAEHGASDYALADLEPGEYVGFCPIPIGDDGPPHFTQGMVTSFEIG